MTVTEQQVKRGWWPVGAGIERRKFSCYQFIGRVFIGTERATFSAVSVEISQGGMSAATLGDLTVGQTVTLTPVAGQRVKAIVRRNQATTFGFELIDLPAEIGEQIKTICETLPLAKHC
jgi:PilZ domain-containing protein